MTVFILAVAFVGVFLQASSDLPRHWLGAQIDLLPAIDGLYELDPGPDGYRLARVVRRALV